MTRSPRGATGRRTPISAGTAASSMDHNHHATRRRSPVFAALTVVVCVCCGCEQREVRHVQYAWPGEPHADEGIAELSADDKKQLDLIYAQAEPLNPDGETGQEVLAFVQSLEPGLASTKVQMRTVGEGCVALRFSGDEPVTIDGMLIVCEGQGGQWRVERRYIFSVE